MCVCVCVCVCVCFIVVELWKCSSVVERLLKVRRIVESIHLDFFFVPASAPRLIEQRPWYVLSACGMMHIAASRKE